MSQGVQRLISDKLPTDQEAWMSFQVDQCGLNGYISSDFILEDVLREPCL